LLPSSVKWHYLAGAPYYAIQYEGASAVVLINGETGQQLPRVDEDLARRIAAEAAPPGTRVVGCKLQREPSLVYLAGDELPVYRVALSDASDVYISPTSGQVFYHADRLTWAIRFAFYGLHVWKWSGGAGPHASYLLLLGMALLLCLSSITGLLLLLGGRWPRFR
jgi:hypothetical protein